MVQSAGVPTCCQKTLNWHISSRSDRYRIVFTWGPSRTSWRNRIVMRDHGRLIKYPDKDDYHHDMKRMKDTKSIRTMKRLINVMRMIVRKGKWI